MLAAMLLLVGCGQDPERSPRDRTQARQPVELLLLEDGRPDPAVLAAEQVLHRDNADEPQTLDPHLAEGVPAGNILRDLFEGLTAESPEGRIVPGVAIRWNISRDGRTYTFYLRRDARWSNGDPLRAEDFVYSFRRSADPATASNSANMLLPIENAGAVLSGMQSPETLGVEALDEFTLQIRLTDPTPYFLGLLTHSSTYPVHRPSVEEHGGRFSRPGNLVSNGAYVLSDWVVRSRIELVRNDLYWDTANTIIDKVVYHPLEDQSASLKQFRAGAIQWTYEVPNNQFRWLLENYSDELVISPWLGSYFFGFNLQREPFIETPMLRRALVLAIDRELITEKVSQFGEKPSFTLVPPGIGEYVSPIPEYAGWTQEERNEEARRLYEAAGYTEEDPLRIEIRYNTSENHKKIALAIASLWKQVLGVQATLVNEEWKVFLQNRSQRILTQVFRAGWIGDYADPYSFLQLFRTEHGQNDYGFSNSLYDSLLEQIAAERIPARRRRLMQEAERVLLEELPIIPVYTYVTKRLVDPHLRGWASNVMDHHYSKHMFLLRSRGDAPAEDAAP
jgi:oligopeptide transport system substrate-binding protein